MEMKTPGEYFRVIFAGFMTLVVAVIGWIIHDIQVMKSNRWTSKDAEAHNQHQRDVINEHGRRMDRMNARNNRIEIKVDNFQRKK